MLKKIPRNISNYNVFYIAPEHVLRFGKIIKNLQGKSLRNRKEKFTSILVRIPNYFN